MVSERVIDESGFFIYFSVPSSVAEVATQKRRMLVDDVHFELEGLEYGASVILFVDDGYIHIFEGYLHGNEKC